MEVTILSVPYTGTNFTADLFVRCGFERIGLDDHRESDRSVRVAHCIEPKEPRGVLVATCRHPVRVAESFRRKGKDLGVMAQAFDNLAALSADYWLCVDSPCREAQLDQMAAGLNLPLGTDWEPISSKSGTYGHELPEFPTDGLLADLLSRHKRFFGQWYELV